MTTDEEVRKSTVKPTFINDIDFVTECDELAATEIKMRKTKIVDDLPVHFGVCILQ